MMVSCGKRSSVQPEPDNSLTFTLKVVKTDVNQADISISHNGSADDTWFGFVTSDVTSDVTTLAQKTASSAVREGLLKGKAMTVKLESLEPQTAYRYIAFGVTQDAKLYGQPAAVSFQTAKKPEDPGTDNPGTDEPGTDEPGTDEPGTDDPGTDNPGTNEPGTDEPGTDNPGGGQEDGVGTVEDDSDLNYGDTGGAGDNIKDEDINDEGAF